MSDAGCLGRFAYGFGVINQIYRSTTIRMKQVIGAFCDMITATTEAVVCHAPSFGASRTLKHNHISTKNMSSG